MELDKLAGDPVDVFVNDRLVARGEVLVLNDSFCVRVNGVPAVKEEACESRAACIFCGDLPLSPPPYVLRGEGWGGGSFVVRQNIGTPVASPGY